MKNNVQLYEILERITDTFLVLNKNWCFTYINKSAAAKLNRNPDELIGKNIWEIFPETVGSPFQNAFLKVMKTQQFVLLEEHSLPLNKWFETHIYPSPEGITIFTRDISERKKAEEKIISSEAQYRRLFETAKDGILILNADSGEIEEVNNFLIQLLGYSHNEFLGKEVWEISLFKDIIANKKSFIKLQKEGYIRYDNLPLETKDGRKIWVEFVSNAYHVNGKQVIQCNIRDISERKKAEQEILQKNKDLKELTEHLQNIREEERKKIAREIHDELGQQLAAIKIDAKWLSKKTEKEELLKNRIDEMLLQIDETIKIIRKISSELRPEILDELGLLAAIEWKAEEFVNRTGIRCNLKIDCRELDLPYEISINIFRIIQESLLNITKHSEATKVNIYLKLENNNLIILISDNGKGFDSEKTKNKKSFGLIDMNERADMIGGVIKIISKEEKGTTVELIIHIG